MATTIRDIAKHLNVSHTTVSRVLNGRGAEFISQETQQRVLTAVREMNYRPNRAARALATGRSNTVALWLEDVRMPYFVMALHHVKQQLQRSGMNMVYVSRARGGEDDDIFQWSPDGIIAFDGGDRVQAYVESAPPGSPPIVSVGCYYNDRVDFVGVDLYSGAYAAVQRLVSIGCRRIAYLVSEWGNHAGDARYDGCMDALREVGREPDIIVAPDAHRGPSRRVIAEYVQERGCPDGLFCFSDDMAIGAYRGLRDRGLRIPEDVAMIGCDGIEDTEYLDSPLSTIAQPNEEMCALAWEYLKRRMEQPDAPLQQTLLKPRLILRESSEGRVSGSNSGSG